MDPAHQNKFSPEVAQSGIYLMDQGYLLSPAKKIGIYTPEFLAEKKMSFML
jgi:hypothetical protein